MRPANELSDEIASFEEVAIEVDTARVVREHRFLHGDDRLFWAERRPKNREYDGLLATYWHSAETPARLFERFKGFYDELRQGEFSDRPTRPHHFEIHSRNGHEHFGLGTAFDRTGETIGLVADPAFRHLDLRTGYADLGVRAYDVPRGRVIVGVAADQDISEPLAGLMHETIMPRVRYGALRSALAGLYVPR